MAGGKVEVLVEPDLRGFPGKLQAGLSGATGIASAAGRSIAAALGVGLLGAGAGFKAVIDLGVEFQNNLNTLQAVSGATAQQMQQVSATAQALGSDLSLPATSAADAAAAMTELAKGGLTVDQAMTAAKGTLQLAAAAQIEAAKAAEIQTNALNAFGLSADQAGHVADVLANTANAASGEITDFALAFQASGAVAHQFGVSLEDTSTALGIFANAGIKGSDAGTLLKSMLLGLVNQSKPAQAALSELGVNAFDAQGKFKGLPVVFDQLRAAAQRMTPEQYAAATATAFGSDAARAAGIAAGLSADGWDKMSVAVGKAGGAQQVAAAKSKGLGGAIEGLKSQLETVAIDIYQKISPALEDFVRQGAEGIPKIADGVGGLLSKLAPIGSGFAAVVTKLAPIGAGIRDIITAGSGLGVVGASAKLLGAGLQLVATILGPIASLAGGVLTVFSQLPGPIQLAVTALLALRFAPALLTALSGGLRGARTEAGTAATATGLFSRSISTLTAPVRAVAAGTLAAGRSLKGFGDEMRLQQQLALGYGKNLTTLQAAHAAYATSSNAAVTSARAFTTTLGQIKAGAAAAGAPISTFTAATRTLAAQGGAVGKIGTAFVNAASGAQRFGTLAGGAAAVGKTIQLGLGGLVSFLGGPWGVAFAAAGVVLTLFGQHQAEATKKAQEHQAALDQLRGTLDTYSGAVTESTIAQKQQQLAQDGTLKSVESLGINVRTYTEATLGNADALKTVQGQLQTHTEGLIAASGSYQRLQPDLARFGISLSDIAAAANGSEPALAKLDSAVTSLGVGDARTTSMFQGLVRQMMDAAKPASELAKSLGLDAAGIAKLQDQQRLATAGTKDFGSALTALGPALAGLKGGVQPTQQLQAGLDGLGTSAQTAATAAGKASLAVGGNLASAAEAAKTKMTELRQQFIDLVAPLVGGTDAAAALADKIGLIPDKAALQFSTNAPAVQKEVDGIVAKLNAVPGQKEIVIDAPTAEVEAGLTAVGLKVTAIPGTKQVRVEVDTAAAQAKAAALTTLLNSITATAKVDADIAPGTAKGQQLKTTIDAITAIIAIDGNPQPGTDKANKLKELIDSLIGILTADANTDPGSEKAKELKAFIDALQAAIPVDADTSAAEATIEAFRSSQEAKAIKIQILATGGATASGHAAGSYDVKGYARGGMTAPRRISNLRAEVVRPGQMRLIGDNMRWPEAFIPLNPKDRRARAILLAALAKMNMLQDIRGYADGGISTDQFRQTALDIFSRANGNQISTDTIAAAVRAAGGGGRTPGDNYTFNVATGNRVGPADVSNEVVQRLRHARRGVHSDR